MNSIEAHALVCYMCAPCERVGYTCKTCATYRSQSVSCLARLSPLPLPACLAYRRVISCTVQPSQLVSCSAPIKFSRYPTARPAPDLPASSFDDVSVTLCLHCVNTYYYYVASPYYKLWLIPLILFTFSACDHAYYPVFALFSD